LNVWSIEELRRFLSFVADEPLYPVFRMAAMTGVRRGEAIALRWRDVEFDNARLLIRQSAIAVRHKVMIQPPKTGRNRSVTLDAITLRVLRDCRSRAVADRLAAGLGRPSDDDFIFTDGEGQSLHPESVAKVFDRRVARGGLPRIRFHDLRHSHATHLIAAGVHVKVVSERLGHSSVAFTLDRYGHVLPNLQSDAATAVADLVFAG
jgi:integrase